MMLEMAAVVAVELDTSGERTEHAERWTSTHRLMGDGDVMVRDTGERQTAWL